MGLGNGLDKYIRVDRLRYIFYGMIKNYLCILCYFSICNIVFGIIRLVIQFLKVLRVNKRILFFCNVIKEKMIYCKFIFYKNEMSCVSQF